VNLESKESEKVPGSELSYICLHLSILTLFLRHNSGEAS